MAVAVLLFTFLLLALLYRQCFSSCTKGAAERWRCHLPRRAVSAADLWPCSLWVKGGSQETHWGLISIFPVHRTPLSISLMLGPQPVFLRLTHAPVWPPRYFPATLRLVHVSSRNLLLHLHSLQDASTPLWVLPIA